MLQAQLYHLKMPCCETPLTLNLFFFFIIHCRLVGFFFHFLVRFFGVFRFLFAFLVFFLFFVCSACFSDDFAKAHFASYSIDFDLDFVTFLDVWNNYYIAFYFCYSVPFFANSFYFNIVCVSFLYWYVPKS